MSISLYGNVSAAAQPLIDPSVVYETQTMKVIVPECPLGAGSLKIEPLSDYQNFSEWGDFNNREAYELIKKIVQVWEKQGITDYLVYGKESDSASPFSWEIVPFPKDGTTTRFLKQFNLLWNITFGGASLSTSEQERIIQNFQEGKNLFSEQHKQHIETINHIAHKNDVFCNPKIIENQLVFEGKEVNVLYNYAPIVPGSERLHFLIVPKKHRPKFSDLSETEYVESMHLAQKLIGFYKDKGYSTAYIFDKSGKEAGQTVPHWHEHVVIPEKKVHEFLGILTVFKNILIGPSCLSPEELQTRVGALREKLRDELLRNERK